MKEIANRVYMESKYASGNVGLIATGQGAILVDMPMLPDDAQEWLEKVSRVSEQGLAYLISTDYQGPRLLGNAFFDGPRIMHQYGWEEIESRGESTLQKYVNSYRKRDQELARALADLEVVLPEVCVVDQIRLHKGREVEVIHLGGHSPASLGIYVPDCQVLFAGDVVVTGEHPQLADAETVAWMKTLDQIKEMDIEVIVPGRGEPCLFEALDPLKAYIQEMRERVADWYEKGTSRRDTVDKVRSEMLDRFPIREPRKDRVMRQIRSSIERVYEEVRKGQ
jgi:cyclase